MRTIQFNKQDHPPIGIQKITHRMGIQGQRAILRAASWQAGQMAEGEIKESAFSAVAFKRRERD